MYQKAILSFKGITSKTHIYLISGHSQNEGNSEHSNLERQIKEVRHSGQSMSLILCEPYRVGKKRLYDIQKPGIDIERENTNKKTFKISDAKSFKTDQD